MWIQIKEQFTKQSIFLLINQIPNKIQIKVLILVGLLKNKIKILR
jgi:hypothetical protein